MSIMSEIFDTDAFQQMLKADCIGKKIIYTDVTGSTMDDARKFGVSDPAQYPHGSIFMAERQTKARGARDHKWDASNTGNIYVSVILHMPQTYKTFEGRFDLEVAACMAVFGVAHSLGVKAIPKWPNDLWLRGHKLAGFLVEDARFDIPGSNMCLVILGMGINVNADVRRNPGLYSIATSLMCERNGRRVCREEFLSNVCLALDETLMSRTNNLLKYRTHNLFQKGCHISVMCTSENRVIDGEFIEVCDNWDIRFSDKRTGEILQGRSDYFTMRPKVNRKILVVFTGLAASKTASVVASRLSAIVDTSKWVVCSVPETAVTQAEDWMKTCDLLVLANDVCDSVRLTSKLTQYLKRGGNLLTTGLASYFTAKIFEIPFKEGRLKAVGDNSDVSIISVEYENYGEEICECTGNNGDGGENKQNRNGNTLEPSTSTSSATSVVFPTSLVYFKFSRHYVMKETSSSPASTSSAVPRGGKSPANVSVSDPAHSQSFAETGGKNMSLKYFRDSAVNEEKEKEYCIAVMLKTTTYGGNLAVFGFDLGHDCLPSVDLSFTSSSDGGKESEKGGKECDDISDYTNCVESVNNDRFKRDKLVYEVLNALNIT